MNEPIAIELKLGRTLSGRYEKINNISINLNQTHFFFTVQSSKTFETLNIAKSFKSLWDVESELIKKTMMYIKTLKPN